MPQLIRNATTHDAEAIASLNAELGYEASVDEMAKRVSNVCSLSSDLLLVVEVDQVVVAWIHAHSTHLIESGSRAEILGLVVRANHKRKGIGTALMKSVEVWASTLGAPTIIVRSNIHRIDSHLFYPKLGYQEAKTQKVYRKQLSSN